MKIPRSWIRHDRVYILPTGFGVLYGASLFLMLLMAFTFNNNLAYLLTFFLTGFGLAALWSTHVFMRDVKILAEREVCATRGDSQTAPARPVHGTWPQAPVDIEPKDSAVRAAPSRAWSCERRGVFQVNVVKVSSSFPTGLFHSWKFVPAATSWYSAPRPLDHSALLKGGDGDHPQSGRWQDHDMGDLQSLSPAGDSEPDSRIDWKAFARGQGRLKKDFEDRVGDAPFIRWKETEPLGDTERRLEQFSYWVEKAAGRSHHWRAELPEGRVSSSLPDVRRALAAWESP